MNDNKSVLAGFLIGFAALLSCSITNNYLATLFFSIGLLYIRICKLSLYTGQIQNVKNGSCSLVKLLSILVGNIQGASLAMFLLLIFQRYDILETYDIIQSNKWIYPWYHYVSSGIGCGILMTIATKKETPLWVSSLCVVAFILAGFNHSIADWFYVDLKQIHLWLCVVLGNFIGGYIVAIRKEDEV